MYHPNSSSASIWGPLVCGVLALILCVILFAELHEGPYDDLGPDWHQHGTQYWRCHGETLHVIRIRDGARLIYDHDQRCIDMGY